MCLGGAFTGLTGGLYVGSEGQRRIRNDLCFWLKQFSRWILFTEWESSSTGSTGSNVKSSLLNVSLLSIDILV